MSCSNPTRGVLIQCYVTYIGVICFVLQILVHLFMSMFTNKDPTIPSLHQLEENLSFAINFQN